MDFEMCRGLDTLVYDKSKDEELEEEGAADHQTLSGRERYVTQPRRTPQPFLYRPEFPNISYFLLHSVEICTRSSTLIPT